MWSIFGEKKQQKKMNNTFSDKLQLSLKTQFCECCSKVQSTKVAFAPNVKNSFTCKNCQLKAVGGDLKNLGEKCLITNEKLSDIITKQLITYQNFKSQPSDEVKKVQNDGTVMKKGALEVIEQIKIQLKSLSQMSNRKGQELAKQSEKQNLVFVFEQLTRMLKEKNLPLEEIKNLISKRALSSKKGLHFINQDAIQSSNTNIDQRYSTLKKESKPTLKEIQNLTNFVNAIEI